MKQPSLDSYRPQSDADLTQVGLIRKVSPLVEAFQGRLPTENELKDVSRELGLEVATMLFRLVATQESHAHGRLLKHLRAMDLIKWKPYREAARGIEVAVVASQLFQPGRKWGDHTEVWRNWAREWGFSTETIDTKPEASVSENAQIIREFLEKQPHQRRIVVTYGQGASELRMLLRRRIGENFGLKGWVNVCGAFGGAASSDYLTAHPVRKSMAQARMKIAGRNPVALQETSSRFAFWREPFARPPGVNVVSLVGAPVRSQIAEGYHALYHEISKRIGPNDGMVGLHQAVAGGGLVHVIDEMSHRAEDAQLKPAFQRTLGLLAMDVLKEVTARLEDDVEADFSGAEEIDYWLST